MAESTTPPIELKPPPDVTEALRHDPNARITRRCPWCAAKCVWLSNVLARTRVITCSTNGTPGGCGWVFFGRPYDDDAQVEHRFNDEGGAPIDVTSSEARCPPPETLELHACCEGIEVHNPNGVAKTFTMKITHAPDCCTHEPERER